MIQKSNKQATLNDVARKAGVSTATASYVLSNKKRPGKDTTGISAETSKKVKEAAESLNYRVNTAARSIKTGKTGMILLCLHMISDPWAFELAEIVTKKLSKHKLSTLVLADVNWFHTLKNQRFDAVFIDGVLSEEEKYLQQIIDSGQKILLFDNNNKVDNCSKIISPNISGCQMAVKNLIDKYQDTAVIAPSEMSEKNDPNSRLSIYIKELKDNNIELLNNRIELYSSYDKNSALLAAIRLLRQENIPRAVFAISDYVALAVIQAAAYLGIKIPQDLAVVGVGNTLSAQNSVPKIASVGPENISESIANILLEMTNSGEEYSHKNFEFKWKMYKRESF